MLLHLSGIWLVLINGVAWVAIQLGVAYLCCRIPARRLDCRRWLFRPRGWERGGAIYQDVLHIKKWKSLLPSGGAALGATLSLARIESHDPAYLRQWARESCRGELTHWLAMAPVILFGLWNPPVGVAANAAYALVANLPCVLVQRYNRPRVLAALARRAEPGSDAAAQVGARREVPEASSAIIKTRQGT